MKSSFFILHFLFFSLASTQAQVQSLRFDEPSSFTVTGLILPDKKELVLPCGLPFYSVMIDSNFYHSWCFRPKFDKDGIMFVIADSIDGIVKCENNFRPGLKYTIRFTNKGKGSHKIENLVPLGEGPDKVYITATGTKEWPAYLCRSVLSRPGYGPVGVILPDNAWHLGFADFRIDDTTSLTGLSRRSGRDKDKTEIDRWTVTLKPGGWVEYNLFFDIHKNDWHDGLKMMFQDRWLYDLPVFDDALFRRSDLQWMKNTYIMLLQFAWDKEFFDPKEEKYTFYKNLFKYDSLTGGYDIYTLWPTWPRLGLDQRNQWDIYRDLPGGLKELNKQVDFIHQHGKKYFISYNPWDESTRKEDQFEGMEELLRSTGADGVVLDTKGSSSFELQAAADKVKPGIIMYSEGMAIPKDMPGIVSGRVHDALVLPPPVNLNKFIKPDFAIFRVLQLADDRLHRELAISFFNGYGVEINTMRPGRPSWVTEEYSYLGKTTRILRENNSVFHNYQWVPLLPTLTDSVYVNQWSANDKAIFTIYSAKPAGYKGPLFEISGLPGNKHLVDLWNHKETEAGEKNGKKLIPAEVDPFDKSWLNTRREGNAGCIGLFPVLIEARLSGETLVFSANKGDKIILTGENPTYRSKQYSFPVKENSIGVRDYFEITTEKIVIQLFDKSELMDERVLYLKNDIPVLVSSIARTKLAQKTAKGMVKIPAGDFRFYTKRDPESQEPFIALPDYSDTTVIHMETFYIDKYPVTNMEFKDFIKMTGYAPRDTANYLKHWIKGNIPAGEENYPVVYVCREDALAYAAWATKRLPTEAEWQYAAQGTGMNKYSWGNTMDSTKCNFKLNHPTSVSAYPQGASPFGVEDLIGNVWQLTNDLFDIGNYCYTIIKGGSFYHPTSSIWYITGGPLPADHPEILLIISPGLDRNSTVGFRCVKDGE
jgi:gamma-glutamyl hercynylcysteine S-oxide synthase